MLTEALTALASNGGKALVAAMVTDGWEVVKARFARLLGRGDAKETEAVAAQLEQSRAVLAGLSGPGFERARAEQEIAWHAQLGALLEQHPGAEGELKALVDEVRAQVIGSRARVKQHSAAYDQAQQVVQGQGVLNVNFGRQGGSGAS